MDWKNVLVQLFSASSVLIKSGITLVLLAITLISAFIALVYIFAPTASSPDEVAISRGFGLVVCLPAVLVSGIFLLISSAWAFAGLRDYFSDLKKIEKKKSTG